MYTLVLAAGEAKPIAVEVVGGDDKALHIILALAGSGFVAVAAISAAVVAARTANRRQQAQLDHDIEVRRHEHMRDALDNAAERLYNAFEALAVYELRIDEAEKARAALKEAQGDEQAQAESQVDTAHAEVEDARHITTPLLLAMQASEFQLKLRIGGDNPTVRAYESAKVSFAAVRNALDKGSVRDRTDDEKSECDALDAESTSAYEEFLAAAEAWNDERT
jgi:hypothetical protein